MSIKSKRRSFLIVAIASILLIASSFVSTNNYIYDASARVSKSGANVSLGKNMLSSGEVSPNGKNKTGKWTAQELFNSVKFTSFGGVSDKNDTAKSYNNIEDADVKGNSELWSDEKVKERVKSAELRGLFRKNGSAWEVMIPNAFLGIAKGVTKFSSYALNALFTESLFGSGSNSIDLVDIIGGSGKANSKGGIIGMFFSSIYMPMVVIASVLVAVHLMKKGIMERKFREALSDSLWAILSVIIGIALMRNPNMLASMPYKVTNQISTCVVGAMHGENCFTGKPTMSKPSRGVSTECISGAEGIEGFVEGMSCTVWKSFVLEPWAKAQFGYEYNDLYTRSAPEGHTVWKGLPEEIDADTYCVALGSKNPKKYGKGDKVVLDNGPSVCNVALYQAYLQTDAHDTVNHSSKGPVYNGIDDRWWDIILPMAKDDSNWLTWAGKDQASSRMGSAFVAMIGAIVTSSLLITLGIQGAAYKVAGTLLMAFAPLFFLLAMIPDKGRKMFLGWFESVVSSILKYLATSLFAIVSVLLFSSVLENTSGITSFVAIIILSSTMYAYRNEVASIIGAANYGGERLSNQLAEQIDEAADKGKSVAGGAMGGMLAGGKPFTGAHEALMRERRKGDTVTARMWQQYNRQKGSGGAKKDKDKDSKGDEKDKDQFENTGVKRDVKKSLRSAGVDVDGKERDDNEYEDKASQYDESVDESDEKTEVHESERTIEVIGKDDDNNDELSDEVKNMSDDKFVEFMSALSKNNVRLDENEAKLLREEFANRAEANPELMNSELAIDIKMSELRNMDMDELKEATDAADRHYMETGEGFSELEASIREYGRRQNFSDDVVEGIIENKRAAHEGGSVKDIPTSQYAGLTGDEAQDLVEEMRQSTSDSSDGSSGDVSVNKLPDIDEVDRDESGSNSETRRVHENITSEARQDIVDKSRANINDNSQDSSNDEVSSERQETQTEVIRETRRTSPQSSSGSTQSSENKRDGSRINRESTIRDNVQTQEQDLSDSVEDVELPDIDDNEFDDTQSFTLPDLDSDTAEEIRSNLNEQRDSSDE